MLSPACLKMIKEGRGKQLLKCWSAVEGFIDAREGKAPSPGGTFASAKKLRGSYMKGFMDGQEINKKESSNE